MTYSLGHTAQKNTFKCTKWKFLHKPPAPNYVHPYNSPGGKRKENFALPTFYIYITKAEDAGRAETCGQRIWLAAFFHADRLREVAEQNAARASRLQELYTFFLCLLVGWCTKKQSLGGSISRFLSSYSWEHCSFNKLLRTNAMSCVVTSSTNLQSI